MGKKNTGKSKKSTNNDLDSILADIQSRDMKKAQSVAKKTKAKKNKQNKSSGNKWLTKEEVDSIISVNLQRDDWYEKNEDGSDLTKVEKEEPVVLKQTTPEPSVPTVLMYDNKQPLLFPGTKQKAPLQKIRSSVTLPLASEGETVEYENISREKELEKESKNQNLQKELKKARVAAETHRTVRQWLQKWMKPGYTMQYICETTENKIRELLLADGLQGGIGFPMGCSLNHCAAHYTPNSGDMTVLKKEDVVKIDIGIHSQGRIVDSAFTMCFEPKFDPLLEAVKEATNAGIDAAGIDVRLLEVGAAVEEVMTSHEVELDGKTYDVKCIENLCGHNIEPYRIHGGKSVPIVSIDPQNVHLYNEYSKKMEENEFFAIETFGSIRGKGRVIDDGECSHYSINKYESNMNLSKIKLPNKERSFLNFIEENFGTLPFCRRYIDRLNKTKYFSSLLNLVRQDIITDYPPLCDDKGSYVAQYEHSIVLRSSCKEILSRGDDY